MKKLKLTVTAALSVFVLVVAAIIFASYFYNLPVLKSVLKNSQINFNTAICFLLSAICLLISNVEKINKPRRIVIDIFSAIIFIIGGVGLIELIFNVNFGIDTLFYSSTDPTKLNGSFPRIDPLISSLFIFLSLIFILLERRKSHLFIQILLIIGLIIEGMIFIIVAAVLFDLDHYQFFSPFVHNSFLFIALFTGIYLSKPLTYIHISFQKQIAAYFIVVLVIMTFLLFAIVNVNRQTGNASKRIETSNKILSETEQILNNSQSMEISTRGFIISGKPVFLESIDRSVPRLRLSLSSLKQYSNESTFEKKSIDSLQQLVEKNIETRQKLIDIRKTKGSDSATAFFEKAIVQQKLNFRLQEQISDFQYKEKHSLEIEKSRYQESIHNLNKIIDLFYFILVLLLLVSFLIIYKNTRARNKAEKEIKELNATLEKRVEEKSREIVEKEKEYRFHLEKRAEELQISNRELERFSYVASHDLQEPLRMVTSFLQLLDKKLDGSLDEKSKTYINHAVDGAERMKRLIQDLLEYSRVGNMELKVVDVDCNEIMKTVNSFYNLSLKERNAILVIKPLPVIQGVKPQILQLFQNLVGNALKYNDSDQPEIEVGYTEEPAAYQFYVKDNGIGIHQKYFEKIFVVFQRLHNKSQYSGTGIGLSICKKIINQHGGRIWVESQPGHGATFYFTIPKIKS
ncbi:MAG: sensor histidine kinase [Ginsengibacter sp.]